jgi:small subunit ribosomal protein S15
VVVLRNEEKTKIISDFGQNAQDTGSAEVQVALLTQHIGSLTGHCQANPKDYSSRRGLLKMVFQRKRLLRYLENTNEERYQKLISKLGLRK